MSTTNAGRTVGALFLSAFVLYGGGSFLLTSTTDSAAALPSNADSLGQLTAGAILLLLNSVAVATIGVVAFRALKRRHRRTATFYIATRTVEAVLLALPAIGTLTLALLAPHAGDGTTQSGLLGLATTAVETGETAYWLAMATLGVGSVFFCRALLKSALLPRFLAVWGMVGYAVFALGSALELAGHEVGLLLSAPGGLFEAAAGCYLVVKGFKASTPRDPAGTGLTPPPVMVGQSAS